jgi:hypothetical protein
MQPSPSYLRPALTNLHWALAFAAACALAVFAYLSYSRWWLGRGELEELDDFQAVYASPYLNARPGVAYVGDAKCAECHASIAETYKKHPMGQSLFAAADFPPIEQYDEQAHDPFQKLGFEFAVAKLPGKLTYTATKRDGPGKTLTEEKVDIHYVMGSGTRGRSYLRSQDGYLFQVPVSWYSQKKTWDLSPGFETIYPPDRPVETGCLFCHANQVEPVRNTRNHYQEPVFRGLAIGCERCHGPGDLHVKARERGDPAVEKADFTIVNPASLSPMLREAVCQQCHLQGERRFERRGREPFDYRPGLPLHQFLSVWIRSPALNVKRKAVGHFEQMFDSVCFKNSSGKMGCITCHDPHYAPKTEEKVALYKSQCLKCHQDKGCSLPASERLKQRPDDSCVACHMPRFQSSDIVHTAVTDHRILRSPSKEEAVAASPSRLQPGENPIVNFFEQELSPPDGDYSRDMGIALIYMGKQPGPMRDHTLSMAFPLLENALQRRPRDVACWEAKGWALALKGLENDALNAYDKALELAPEREMSLLVASSEAERLGRHDQAIAYLRRLIKVNPLVWDYHLSLSRQLAATKDWQGCLAESEAALKLNPTGSDALTFLITSCFRLGEEDRAKREFEKLLALKPSEDLALRLWFQGLKTP